MRKGNVVGFVVSTLAVGVIFACGSSPKPDATPPPTPSASAMPSAMPATTMDDAGSSGSSGLTASSGDGGGASASADAGMTKDQQCSQLQTDAQAEMDSLRIKFDKECKKDADCMPIKGRACQFVCTNGAIPKAEQKNWEKEMASVKDGSCKKWNDMSCKKADAKPPTCTEEKKKAACDKGHCTLK